MRGKLFFFAHYVVAFFFFEVVRNQFAVVACAHKNVSALHFLVFLYVEVIEGWISENGEFIAHPFIGAFIEPLVFIAVTNKLALEPGINGAVVVLYVVVEGGFEFV